jgi:hypothetical protein
MSTYYMVLITKERLQATDWELVSKRKVVDGWVNIYPGQILFETKEAAMMNSMGSAQPAHVHVEF